MPAEIKRVPAHVRENIVYEKGLIEGTLCLIDRGLFTVIAIAIPRPGEEEDAEKLVLGPRTAFKHSRLGRALARR